MNLSYGGRGRKGYEEERMKVAELYGLGEE